MYRVSPLTYFLEGMAITGTSGTNITCSKVEMLQIPMQAEAKTCGEYMAAYMREVEGALENSDSTTGPCLYCPISQSDTVLRSLGMSTNKSIAWRNAGILIGYVIFDILLVFVLYYLLRVPKKR